MKTLSILGSTGSIGTQTLDIVQQFPEQFSIFALAAKSNLKILKEQILTFKPSVVCVNTMKDQSNLSQWLNKHNMTTELVYGSSGLNSISSQSVDLLVMAIAGTTGIQPTYTALQH